MPDTIKPLEAVILRTARAEDTPAVAQLLAEAYAEHTASFPPPVWATYSREIAAVAPRIRDEAVIVAEVASALLGTVTLYPGGADGVATLRLLAVRPGLRGSGVGRLLVEACRDRAVAWGCTQLELHTAHFMGAAVRLYERLGFVRIPERDFDAHQRYGEAIAPPDAEPFCGLAYRLALGDVLS